MCTTRLLLSPYSAGATPVMTSIDCTASCGDLVRVDAALLVGDRLVVDRELRLRVVADRMEEAVGIGHDARRGQRDDLVQPAGRRLDRQLRDQALIDVGVRGRIALEQILGVADDLAPRRRAGQRQRQVERDRHAAPHVDVALERLEPLGLDDDVIRIRRQVAEDVTGPSRRW